MNQAQDLVSRLLEMESVSDAFVSATGDQVATTGRFSSCSASESLDVEKTVRRMLAASSTIGATLSQVTLHFGVHVLLAVPLSTEVNVLVLVEERRDVDKVVIAIRGSRLAALLGSSPMSDT